MAKVKNLLQLSHIYTKIKKIKYREGTLVKTHKKEYQIKSIT